MSILSIYGIVGLIFAAIGTVLALVYLGTAIVTLLRDIIDDTYKPRGRFKVFGLCGNAAQHMWDIPLVIFFAVGGAAIIWPISIFVWSAVFVVINARSKKREEKEAVKDV